MVPPSHEDDTDRETPTTSILVRLARIETLLETEFRSLYRQLADHEERLRKGERWRYALPVSAVAAVASAVAAVIAALGR